tara:strand:+ start:115 stop:381 length:267 start_codon:yes stop_codon:yes gene_type:complete
MGKKSRNAGTTKNRTRTCDKPAHQTLLDIVKEKFKKRPKVKGALVNRILKDISTRGVELQCQYEQIRELNDDGSLTGICNYLPASPHY